MLLIHTRKGNLDKGGDGGDEEACTDSTHGWGVKPMGH